MLITSASGKWETQGETFASLVDALAYASAAEPVDLDPHFRNAAGESVGRWLWLDAASEELPANASGKFDSQTIAELAASLESSAMPVPITGGRIAGRTPSEVHGGVDDTAMPANGWAHRGAVVIEDGVSHLYLYAELLPEVADDVVSGRLAYGSVEVTGTIEDGVFRGAELFGHALTNAPANRHLRPASAVLAAGTQPADRVFKMSRVRVAAAKKPEEEKPEEMPPEEAAAAEEAPAEEAPAEPEDKEETIAALEAKVAALTAQLEALTAEAAVATEEGAKAAATLAASLHAKEVVAASIRDGVVHPATREKWEAVVLTSGEGEFREMTKSMRAIPKRVAMAREHGRPVSLDPENSTVKMMRLAGISDATIEKRMVEMTKGEV